MLQAPLGGLPLQMGKLPSLQNLFALLLLQGLYHREGRLGRAVKNGSRLNEGGCGTNFFPGRAAVIGRMPNSLEDEHSVFRIAGHRRGWRILSSLGLARGASSLSQAEFISASGWWWG